MPKPKALVYCHNIAQTIIVSLILCKHGPSKLQTIINLHNHIYSNTPTVVNGFKTLITNQILTQTRK